MGDILWRKRSQRPSQCLPLWQQHGPENHDIVSDTGHLVTVSGVFKMRKTGSPWWDVRLRQAVNVAINREDLIRYATKGNGVIIPALVPVHGFGYDPDLAPYPFNPAQARHLLQEAGY